MKATLVALAFATSLCAAHSHADGDAAQTQLSQLTKEELEAKWGFEVSAVSDIVFSPWQCTCLGGLQSCLQFAYSKGENRIVQYEAKLDSDGGCLPHDPS